MLNRLRSALMPLQLDRSGVTAIEYALIASLIAIVIVATLITVGTSVSGMFMQVVNGF
jgi:pilus assembly protein Flp/PilA